MRVRLSQYLSPEPLLQSPTYVRRMAQAGIGVPTYAYAANNPLRYVDSDGLRVRLRDIEGVSMAFGLNQTPRGAELLRWLDESPFTYDVYGKSDNFNQALAPDVYGSYSPGADRNQCSLAGGGRVEVDALKALENGLNPARVLGHELTHGGLHDQQVRKLDFVPDVIFRYIKDASPGGGLRGGQRSNETGPHRRMDFYWIFNFGGP